MRPRPIVLFALPLLLIAACGPSSSTEDSGRAITCRPGEETTLPVRVVDAQGAPIADAVVTGRNLGSGQVITGTTNHEGVTTALSSGSGIGTGSVELRAQKDTRVSDVGQAEFVCGECACVITPDSVTLRISL